MFDDVASSIHQSLAVGRRLGAVVHEPAAAAAARASDAEEAAVASAAAPSARAGAAAPGRVVIESEHSSCVSASSSAEVIENRHSTDVEFPAPP